MSPPVGSEPMTSQLISLRCSEQQHLSTAVVASNEENEVEDANNRYEGILKIVKTPVRGWSLFASRPFTKGEVIISSRAISFPKERDSHSIQKDWNTHVDVDLPARFINHSCNSNVAIVDNDFSAYDFFALKNIAEGEELVWDYETTEFEISTKFQCSCGSPKCRGVLQGFKYNGNAIKEQYGDFYAAYLKGQPAEEANNATQLSE